jgi:hypothetical protein
LPLKTSCLASISRVVGALIVEVAVWNGSGVDVRVCRKPPEAISEKGSLSGRARLGVCPQPGLGIALYFAGRGGAVELERWKWGALVARFPLAVLSTM